MQMKREIKFRAWCKKTSAKRFPVRDITNLSVSEDDYIIEQYTGRCDEAGIEIYHGDYLTFSFRNHRGKVVIRKGCVVWEQYMWLVQTSEGDQYGLNRIHSVKIIGNIHENPGLAR